jgi:hypothetical protein
MIRVVGKNTGEVYFSCVSKNEALAWILKTFPDNAALRKMYPHYFFKNDVVLPEPFIISRKEEDSK